MRRKGEKHNLATQVNFLLILTLHISINLAFPEFSTESTNVSVNVGELM
jgi:hypothetical protein